jgi:hypothetical protein
MPLLIDPTLVGAVARLLAGAVRVVRTVVQSGPGLMVRVRACAAIPLTAVPSPLVADQTGSTAFVRPWREPGCPLLPPDVRRAKSASRDADFGLR